MTTREGKLVDALQVAVLALDDLASATRTVHALASRRAQDAIATVRGMVTAAHTLTPKCGACCDRVRALQAHSGSWMVQRFGGDGLAHWAERGRLSMAVDVAPHYMTLCGLSLGDMVPFGCCEYCRGAGCPECEKTIDG
jgi:hypothetical protein